MDQVEQLRNIIKKQNTRQHLARVITVTSGKGGVGKSNVSVNLAIQFGKMKKRAVILDADMMFRGRSLKDIITPGPEGIGFISGGSGLRELTNLGGDQVKGLVRLMYELDQIADVVIVDTGAGISDTVINLVVSSSEVLLVATPEPTSITDAYALLKTLCRHREFYENKPRIHMVANRAHSYQEGRELFEKLDAVVEKFLDLPMEYLGHIPYDEKLPRSVMRQQPVSIAYPNASSARAMLDLAMLLENGVSGGEVVRSKGLSGLFSRMFKSR